MQKIIYSTAVALTTVIVMASCSNNGRIASESAQTLPASATELAEFREWKQQQQLQQLQQQLENSKQNNVSYAAAKAPVRKQVVYRTKVVKQTTPAVAPIPPAKKKGWSKAAKGTVIGAGAGAAAGAIIAKNNRALGAVIGGVVGGGGGYVIGRSMDKKDGRY